MKEYLFSDLWLDTSNYGLISALIILCQNSSAPLLGFQKKKKKKDNKHTWSMHISSTDTAFKEKNVYKNFQGG